MTNKKSHDVITYIMGREYTYIPAVPPRFDYMSRCLKPVITYKPVRHPNHKIALYAA